MAKRKRPRRTRGVFEKDLRTGETAARNMPLEEAIKEYGDVFQGTMTCVMCGKTEEASGEETDWRCAQIDDVSFFACPDHFPADDASRSEFANAYRAFFQACLLQDQKP